MISYICIPVFHGTGFLLYTLKDRPAISAGRSHCISLFSLVGLQGCFVDLDDFFLGERYVHAT
jgi:hypothetical protein